MQCDACRDWQAYEDDDRRVRKAGVDVLVKLYQQLGEQLWTFIRGLSDAKVNTLSYMLALSRLCVDMVRHCAASTNATPW